MMECGVNESAASFRTWVMIAPIERFDTFFVVCGKGFPFDFNGIFFKYRFYSYFFQISLTYIQHMREAIYSYIIVLMHVMM